MSGVQTMEGSAEPSQSIQNYDAYKTPPFA